MRHRQFKPARRTAQTFFHRGALANKKSFILLMLFRHFDNRFLLDLNERTPDYRPVRGLGKDRSQFPDVTKLVCLIRQRGVCAYCCVPLVITIEGKRFGMYGKTASAAGELDHVIPAWQGGRDRLGTIVDYRNLCYLCQYHNSFEFKGGGIELHGAFQTARLGQMIKEDWRAMLAAFISSGLKIYAIPFWWYQSSLPRRLNLPGYSMDSGKLDVAGTFAIEKRFFDGEIKKFLDGSRWPKLKKMVIEESVQHDAAYR